MPPNLVIRSSLAPPAPNPAAGAVQLGFAIGEGETGSIEIFDLAGRSVRTLVEQRVGPVSSGIQWDLKDNHGRPVATGIYFARLETESTKANRRIVLIGR
jgi:hypothetical protein